ncbi:MAG TPA: NADH dehydrogenase (quinone) subunit D [Longimicrobium sp.]
MSSKLRRVIYNVARNPELSSGGSLVHAPIVPVAGEEARVQDDISGEHMLINIGPQHPATHGVLRLVLELDGETVVRCIPHIGYLHSSFEKLGEYRDWNQVIPLTDRMDYLAPLIYNCAYAMSVEKLMGVEVTERCKVVRLICMELDRIFSHLLWLGTTAIDLGAFTVFLYTFQQRELIYDLHESFTGARLTTSSTRIGGMMADLPAGWIDQLNKWIEGFLPVLDEVDTLLTNNGIWIGRTQGVGTISAEDAVNFGLSGPNLRASGVSYDVRKDRPYYDMDSYDFDVPVGEHGDIYDRYLCRMEEMRQSVRLLRQMIQRLPGGPINVDDPRVILPPKTAAMNDMESMIHHFKLVMEGVRAPVGESWFSVESSKGELGMYVVSDGGSKPVRWRVRGPSFINIAALPHMIEGALLSDVIAVNASLDIVLGEIDR